MVKAAAAMTPLYEQPMLVVDPDMHTARVNSVAVDAAGRLAVNRLLGQDCSCVVARRWPAFFRHRYIHAY
jgi:hypothetical protein